MELFITFLVILFFIGVVYAIDAIPSGLKKASKIKEQKDKIRKKSNELNEFDKNIERLKKLGELYKDGIITKEEFEEKRNKFNL